MRNPSTAFETLMLRILAIGILLTLATVVLAA